MVNVFLGLPPATFICNATACGKREHRFPIGESIVKFSVKDRSGNENVCSFEVKVKGKTVKTLRCNL